MAVKNKRWAEKQFQMIEQSAVSMGLGQFAAGLAVYILGLKDSISHWWLIADFAIACGMGLIPILAKSTQFSKTRLVRLYDANLYAMPILWAYPTLFLLPHFSPDMTTAYSLVLAGISAAVTIAYLHQTRTSLVLIWGIILPFSCATLFLTNEPSYVMSTLAFIFACTLSYQQSILHKMLLKEFELGEENQRLLRENQVSMETLVQSSKMVAIAQMTGGIAHEINNPLAIISSSSVALRKCMQMTPPNPTMVDYCLDTIDNTIERVAKIIHGLRVVSRDQTEPDYKEFNLREVCDDVFGLCSEKFKVNNVNFHSNINQAKCPQQAYGDQVQISQILLNLLVNAFDAIQEPGVEEKWIRLKFSQADDQIIARIIDSGPGIPCEIRENIFDPFVTSKPVGQGTGLGLSLSRSIAIQHGGSLELTEVKGRTCFELKIPASVPSKSLSPLNPSPGTVAKAS